MNTHSEHSENSSLDLQMRNLHLVSVPLFFNSLILTAMEFENEKLVHLCILHSNFCR